MDGDAGFPPAPLKIETQLEPGELTSTRAGPGFGVCNVHICAIPDHEGVAKTLGDVGSAVGAEAEPLFRDKDELVCPREPLGGSSGAGRRVAWARQIVGLGQEDGPHLAEPRRRHDELIRVIFGVVLKAVGRLAEQVAGAIEDGDIAHDGS